MSRSPPKDHAEVHLTILDDGESSQALSKGAATPLTLIRRTAVVFQLCGVNFATSASSGLIVIGLPQLTSDLNIPQSLAFWPSSVQGLATASALLLSGAVADVLGPRSVNLSGCILNGVFMLSCGFIKSIQQLITMRALQGVAIAMHFSSSVALVADTQPRGQSRNISFACLGLSQLLGFTFGLVVGGVLVDTVGWRSGWYLYGGITLLLSAVGLWSLPKSEPLGFRNIFVDLIYRVDWIGALLASVSMASISYFLAVISTDVHRIKETGTVTLLCFSLATLPLFQEIQYLSAVDAGIRILPSTVVGLGLNLMTGLIVHKIPAVWLVAASSLLSSGSPLLMAVINPSWSYWVGAFFAQILLPFSIDVLFTVGLIIVTEVFPEKNQSVAGAVFNTAAQFGNALGLAIVQVVSAAVTNQKINPKSPEALLEGYRASFWTLFPQCLFACLWQHLGYGERPLSVIHKAKAMQLLTANDDLAQLTGGRPLDDISKMPSDDRRAVLCKYLVKEDPVMVQEPVAWSDEESIGRFLLLKRFLNNDESRRHLLLEARRVFYEENSFIISLAGFSRFLDDMLGDWEDAVAVEMLVRDLTIKVERQDCECGQLMEYIQRLSYFAKMPQLQKFTIEWYTPPKNVDDGVPYDWSALSGSNSSKGTSLHSVTDDDSTYEDGGSNETLRWETSDDDIWSLDGDVHG
ncbi:MFS transporter superfamily [Fusarium oxysporum f. sp. vasinfectum]|nr:MFS transporter superfamily [Fusarium oxysporum f. sp. vasinfectum]